MFFSVLFMLCIMGIVIVYKEEIKERIPTEEAKNFYEKRRKDIEFWVMKKSKSRFDNELFNGSVILKNLSLVQKDSPLSADYMYEKLMENSLLLRPAYRQMLTLFRSRNKEDAYKVLPMTVGTRASKNFAIILSKLEAMNPSELERQMEAFQKSMMENKMTQAIKRVQRNSLILTVLSTTTVFVLLLNFVVVVVFLNTIETLNGLFF